MASFGSHSHMFSLVSNIKFTHRNCPIHNLFSVPFRKLSSSNFPVFDFGKGAMAGTGCNDLGLRRSASISFLGCRNPASPAVAKDVNGVFACGGFHLGMFIACSNNGGIHLSPVFHSSCDSLSTAPGSFGGH